MDIICDLIYVRLYRKFILTFGLNFPGLRSAEALIIVYFCRKWQKSHLIMKRFENIPNNSLLFIQYFQKLPEWFKLLLTPRHLVKPLPTATPFPVKFMFPDENLNRVSATLTVLFSAVKMHAIMQICTASNIHVLCQKWKITFE